MSKDFIERPRKNEKDRAITYVQELLKQAREERRDADIDKLEHVIRLLNTKKYGLVWEEHAELVEEEMKNKIPVFIEDETKKIVGNPESEDYNFLLEGDNLHSLYLLKKTHAGKIDVIYIDPPYNTGNKDFIYNDVFVDKSDGYSHSKWLSFMSTRLEIARELLSDEGVIFISIDDNEQAQLKLLCDEVFGEENFVGTLPRITKKSGKAHGSNIAKNHDFIIVYANHEKQVLSGLEINDNDYPLKDQHFEMRGGYKLNQTLDYNSLWYNTKMDYEIIVENQKYYPGGDYSKHIDRHNGNHDSKDWVWRWSIEKFKFGLNHDFIVFKKTKNGIRIYTKTYSKATISKKNDGYFVDYINRDKKLSSLAFVENNYSNDNAKKDLSKVFNSNNIFDFSKPIQLIYDLISLYNRKNATILDFFAGSGTTGHAVVQLNKEDGGNRKYILCTNNENKICEEVTYKRLANIHHFYPRIHHYK